MMIMDGDAAQSLILHEAGHIYTYGILGNNEWRSGWMDEGLTSYQTDWALGKTPQEQVDRPQVPPLIPGGYRIQAATIPAKDSAGLVVVASRASRSRATDRNERRRLLGVRDLQRDDLHAGEGHVRAAARRARRFDVPRVPAALLRRLGAQARRRARHAQRGGARLGARPRMVLRPVGARHGSHGLRGGLVRRDAGRERLAHGRRRRAARRSAASDVRRRAHVERLDHGARGCDGRCAASRDRDNEPAAGRGAARSVSRHVGLGPPQRRAGGHADHAPGSAGHVQLAVPGPDGSGEDACRARARGLVFQSAGHRARPARQDELHVDGRHPRRRVRVHVAQSARPVHWENVERARRGRTCGRGWRTHISPVSTGR